MSNLGGQRLVNIFIRSVAKDSMIVIAIHLIPPNLSTLRLIKDHNSSVFIPLSGTLQGV